MKSDLQRFGQYYSRIHLYDDHLPSNLLMTSAGIDLNPAFEVDKGHAYGAPQKIFGMNRQHCGDAPETCLWYNQSVYHVFGKCPRVSSHMSLNMRRESSTRAIKPLYVYLEHAWYTPSPRNSFSPRRHVPQSSRQLLSDDHDTEGTARIIAQG